MSTEYAPECLSACAKWWNENNRQTLRQILTFCLLATKTGSEYYLLDMKKKVSLDFRGLFYVIYHSSIMSAVAGLLSRMCTPHCFCVCSIEYNEVVIINLPRPHCFHIEYTVIKMNVKAKQAIIHVHCTMNQWWWKLPNVRRCLSLIGPDMSISVKVSFK